MLELTAILICLLVFGLGVSALGEEPESQTPAVNEVQQDVPVGARPYEMAGRTEERVPLFGFEDLGGWTVSTYAGARAQLERSREQQMWGTYVGKLTYSGTSSSSRIVLEPPEPISIPGRFDCINFWVYGNNWGWVPDPKTPMVRLGVVLLDSKDRRHVLELTNVRWKEWWLVHRKLDRSRMEGISFPCKFAGIQITGGSNTEDRIIYLDSLYFYTEALKPLKFRPRPARNLKLPQGQSQGLNGGALSRLPFPTREETILPSNFEPAFSNRVEQSGPNTFAFHYRGKDAEISYTYEPTNGEFGTIKAFVNGKMVSKPLDGSRVRFVEGSPEAREKPVHLGTKLDRGQMVISTFRCGTATAHSTVEYRMQIMQKSLVIDTICTGGRATELTLGQISEVSNPKLILVPYITFGGTQPRVLMCGDAKSPCFTSVWVDWYRSNGSELWAETTEGEKSAKINGGVRYLPKTDGQRNDLFERIFLTVSPVFEETLPTVANPASPWGDVAGERLWQESWGPDNYEKQMKRSEMLRSYGIEKLTQCNHEISWRDGGESFTLRTEAAPKKGGDAALAEYVAHQKSLGWRSGLYTNYTDFAPVNKHWDEDFVQRQPDGEWRPAWPRCYALKPSRAVELEEDLAPVIKQKFDSDAAYTDVHTAVAPWAYCDYDARVPGAGTFAATFYAYGELLLNDKKVYNGPIWSEGTYQWLYAGLTDGNYGLCYGPVYLAHQPLNVAFDLYKIHPLECDIGMPWTAGFLKESGWNSPQNIDKSIDHFLAATIAYGHIGWLVEEEHGIQRTCRSYYMLQQLQKLYAMRRPVKIEYADEHGKFMSASQALITGVMNDSRLHVLYDNGLELFVNGSDGNWQISMAGKSYTLPSWGWCAHHSATGFTEYSALIDDGRRVDYVSSPEYEYLDGRGFPVERGSLAVKGAAVIRHLPGDKTQIIDIYGNEDIGFSARRAGRCSAYDENGTFLGPVELRRSRGKVWLTCVKGARRYAVEPSAHAVGSEVDVKLEFRTERVSGGEKLPAALHVNAKEHAIQITDAMIKGPAGMAFDLPNLEGLRVRQGRHAKASFTVEFPTGLPAGKIWVEAIVHYNSAEGEGEAKGWYDLSAVPPFEVHIAPVALEFAAQSAKADVTIRSNLNNVSGGQVEVAVAGNYEVNRGKAKLSSGEQSAHFSLEITPKSGEVQPDGELRIRAEIGVFAVEKRYPLKCREVQPVFRELASPETAFNWGQCVRGEAERPADSRTGASAFVTSVTSGGVTKNAIFSHPPYRTGSGYTYIDFDPMTLPDEPIELHMFIGLKDGGDPSDGVEFRVMVSADGMEKELLKEIWAKREWKEVAADLSEFAGKHVRIRFIADVGPEDDSTSDWGSWGEPQIRLKKKIVRAEIETEKTVSE